MIFIATFALVIAGVACIAELMSLLLTSSGIFNAKDEVQVSAQSARARSVF